jgi:PhnB protein
MIIPSQYTQLMPYLMVRTAAEFVAFTKEVFGAAEQLIVPRPDGSVMHGELRIGTAVVMFSDASEDYKEAPASLCLLVEDVVAVYTKGLANGAISIQQPGEKEYGKGAGFRDRFGNMWWLIEGIK